MEGAQRQALIEQVGVAARERAALASSYLARVRAATARLEATSRSSSDISDALLAVGDHANLDVDPPTASRWKAFTLVKLVVKRLTRWYFVYVGQQITSLGYAVIRFGTATVERAERLEEATQALQERVDALEARVEQLHHDVDDV
jgi:hypothetical protein